MESLKWKSLLLALFFGLSNCTTLTLEGQMVDIVSDRKSIKSCKFKGLVKSYSGWGGIAASGTGRRNVIVDLRNQTANLGGNVLYLRHLSSGSHITGVSMDGKAYLCKE